MNILKLLHEIVDFLFPLDDQDSFVRLLSYKDLCRRMRPGNDSNMYWLFPYRDPLIRRMIWRIKYSGDKVVAKQFAKILSGEFEGPIFERAFTENSDTPLLIPIPLSRKRKSSRGWNQVELITEAICKNSARLNVVYKPTLLAKVRDTKSQTWSRSKQERLRNLKNSFHVNAKDEVAHKDIILIDDVITTGATFKEASRSLKKAGARNILCIAIAH